MSKISGVQSKALSNIGIRLRFFPMSLVKLFKITLLRDTSTNDCLWLVGLYDSRYIVYVCSTVSQGKTDVSLNLVQEWLVGCF